MNGFAGMILPYLGVRMGFTGDLIQFLTFGVLRGTRTGWPIAILVMILYMVIYYFVFKWAIEKFNIKTPGREDKTDIIDEYEYSASPGSNTAEMMIAALGGRNNIITLDNCVTRLRLVINDMTLINENAIKSNGGLGVVKLDENTLQVIIGTKVYQLRKEMDGVLGKSDE